MPETATATTPLPLQHWRTAPWPHDWNAVLPGSGPLHLEVGFGDGRYTALRALNDPAGRFVGVEVSGVSVLKALRRMHREGVSNVALFKGNAELLLRQLFAEKTLKTITVNFPDPWPKGRHEENRLLKDSFFRLAATRLAPGGSILLATDHPDYLGFARHEATLSGLYTQPAAEAPPEVFETKYALKWKKAGKPLHYQPFVLKDGADPAPFPPLERPAVMPHSLLEGQLPLPTTFEKQVTGFAGGHVILHEVAASIGNADRLLVRATVTEPLLRQQLLVVIQEREPGELIVRLESFGDPVVTDAVRGAVHAVTEWLLGQPGLSLRERHY